MLTATVEKKIDSLPLSFLLVIQLGSNYLGKVSSYDLIQDIKMDIYFSSSIDPERVRTYVEGNLTKT
jgi:hypothetical protein